MNDLLLLTIFNLGSILSDSILCPRQDNRFIVYAIIIRYTCNYKQYSSFFVYFSNIHYFYGGGGDYQKCLQEKFYWDKFIKLNLCIKAIKTSRVFLKKSLMYLKKDSISFLADLNWMLKWVFLIAFYMWFVTQSV